MITSDTKFIHSIRVPRIYKIASIIAKEHSEGNGSIKQLLYENRNKHPNLKAILSLVSTLFARVDILENLLKRSNFLLKEPHCDPWLIKVLIVELLWGKGRLVGQSKPEATVRAYEQVFKAHLSDYKDLPDDTARQEGIWKPRFIRVNTLKLQFNEAVKNFQDDGWTLLELSDTSNYDEFLEKVSRLEEGQFLIDIHISNLLVFPPKTEFHNHPAYKKGSIILQDKASCIPVHLLSPPPGSVVLDMCAAPGMKTTHLAAVLNNNGVIHALERNPSRFEVLSKIVESSGATCVKTVNRDVLSCSREDFPDVEYIIVDPSCTGSGMTNRDRNQDEVSIARLRSLTGFQIKILRSALSKFPKVKRVVYSTCSIYPEENEEVVREVLETNYRFKLVPVKKFLDKGWKNFGTGAIGEMCLYAKPDIDFTDGFFTAVFERLEEGETNQFFNEEVYDMKMKMQYEKKKGDIKNNLGKSTESMKIHEVFDPDRKQHKFEEKKVIKTMEKTCNVIESNCQNDNLIITSVKENDVPAGKAGTSNWSRKKNSKSKNVISEFDTNSNAHKEAVSDNFLARTGNRFQKKKKESEEPKDPFVIQLDMLEKGRGLKVKLKAQKEDVANEPKPRAKKGSKKKNKRSNDELYKEPQDTFISHLEKSLESPKLKIEAHKDEFEPISSEKTRKSSKSKSCGEPQDPSVIQMKISSEDPKVKVETRKDGVLDKFGPIVTNSSKKKRKSSKGQSHERPLDPLTMQTTTDSEDPKPKFEAFKEEVPYESQPIVTNSSKKKRKSSKGQSHERPLDPLTMQITTDSEDPKLKFEAFKEEVPYKSQPIVTNSSKKKRKSSKHQSYEDPQHPLNIQLKISSKNPKLIFETQTEEVQDEFGSRIINSSKKKKKISTGQSHKEPQDSFVIQLDKMLEEKPKLKFEAPVQGATEEFKPIIVNSSKNKKKDSKDQSCKKIQDPFIMQIEKILDKIKLKVVETTEEGSSAISVDDHNLGTKKKRRSSSIVDESEIDKFSAKKAHLSSEPN